MEKKLHILILTPLGKYLEMDADFLSVVSDVSVLGILPNHAPLVTTLAISKMEIKANGVTKYAIGGGVLNIEEKSKVILLLNSIERKDEIDIDRALRSKERAEKLLTKNDIDVVRAKVSLARALNRISVANE